MKCIVISLRRAEERRRAVAKQFVAHGIEFDFLEGVDWRELGNEHWMQVDRDSRHREGRRALTHGMVACHLSHRKAIERIAGGTDTCAAIFEDDVTLAPGIRDVFRLLNQAGQARDIFDFLFLHRNRRDRPYVAIGSLGGGYSVGAVKYSDWGAQSYVVTQQAARHFLERCPQIIDRCDHTLHQYWKHGLRTLSLDPPVVFHGNEPTGHSYIREAAGRRPARGILSGPRRVRSHLREEIRKRIWFRRLFRPGVRLPGT